MRKFTFLIALAAIVFAVGSPASAQVGGLMLPGPPPPSGCSQATAFITRANAVTALDGIHTTAYTNLICGGVTDGWWAKMDILFIFATQSSGVAVLNLLNSTYTASAVNSPTFTTDRGFTGNGSNAQVLTTFNPTTATSPNYTQNSAHISAWNVTNQTSDNGVIVAAGTGNAVIYPDFAGSGSFIRVNDGVGGLSNSNNAGQILGNRDSSTTREAYQNAVSLGSYGTVSSASIPNQAFSALADTGGGSASASFQTAMISVGGSLSGTDVTNFYNRLRTYMTAVGVP